MNTNVIAVLSGKTPLTKCDATCYNADHEANANDPSKPLEVCTCICGGLNHGVGRAAAIENAQRFGHKLATKYIADNKLSAVRIYIVPPTVTQLTLDELLESQQQVHKKKAAKK